MRTPSPTPPCSLARRRRLLLVAGFTVPLVLASSLLGAGAADAAPSEFSTKADLVSAFGTAAGGDTIAMTQSLTAEDTSAEVLTVPDDTAVTLDLAGHELDLDQVVLGGGSTFTVENTAGGGSGLVVGGSPSEAGATTGIEVGQDADFVVASGTTVTTTGSDDLAGIGTVAGSDGGQVSIQNGATVVANGGHHAAGIGGGSGADPARITIDDATVHATGGAGGAGLGGGYANPSSTSVQVSGDDDEGDDATVVARGGAGAAGIGGGEADATDGGGAGASVSFSSADVTAADGGLTTDAPDGTSAPNAIGGGQGTDASAFGSLSSQSGTLRIPAGSTLRVPSGVTLDNYDSAIVVDGVLTGNGTISNQYGAIRAVHDGSIDDEHLTVTGDNHLVTLDPGAGTTTAPTTLRVYASDLQDGGVDLSDYSGTLGDTSLVGWSGVPWWNDGSPYPVSNTTSLVYLTSSPWVEDGAVTITAAYGHPISFTGTTMPGAALGKKYDQAVPATGDVTEYWIGGSDDDDDLSFADVSSQDATSDGSDATTTIAGLPVGMTYDRSTGHITGYPAAPGHYSFTVEISSQYQDESQTMTLDVAGAPTIATSDLPDGTAGSAYSVALIATSDGPGGAITYSVSGGALPAGLSLDAETGVLSGTPTAGGTSTFGLKATNSFGSSRTALTLTVAAATSASDPAPTSIPTTGAPAGIAATQGATTPTAGSTTADAPAAGAPAASTTTATPSASPSAGTPSTNTPSAASTPAPTSTSPGGAAASASAPSAPVLPVVDPSTVKIGHPVALSVAANSSQTVTYTVPAGELPKGLNLDARTGLISGVPQQSGHFTIHVTATSASGSATRSYSFEIPAVKKLLTANVSAVTPKAGSSVEVAIHGLKVNERWHITVDGKAVQTGIAKFGGTVHRKVLLDSKRKDTVHVIRLSGSRTVSDPAVTDDAVVTVTSVAPVKHLSAKASVSGVTVQRLAAKERVMVTLHGKRVAAGRADEHGVFTFSTTALTAGKHRLVVTGSTAKRSTTVSVKVAKPKH